VFVGFVQTVVDRFST